METLTITLPDPVKLFVESEVAAGTFRSLDEYVLSLIQEAQRKKAREKIDQMLVASLESGTPRELTDEVWSEVAQKVEQRAK